IDGTANLKIDGRIARFVDRLKILANRFEKLATNFVVNRELRMEFQLAVKRNCSRRCETNIRRAQNQFVDCDQARTHMIFCLRLLEIKLSEFFNLKNLPQ